VHPFGRKGFLRAHGQSALARAGASACWSRSKRIARSKPSLRTRLEHWISRHPRLAS